MKSHEQSFPAGKSGPGLPDSNELLFRRRCIRKIASGDQRKRILYIEARAGQGKTSLALQYLQHVHADFSWYAIDAGDKDPVALIGTLFYTLADRFPVLCDNALHRMIEGGTIPAKEVGRMAAILISALQPLVRSEFHIVLDDLHLLEKAPDSLTFLRHFVEGAPDHLRFIIVSRIATDYVPDPQRTLRLGNKDLALTDSEIAALFDTHFGRPLLPEAVHTIGRATEGWALGAALIAQSLDSQTNHDISALPDQLIHRKRSDLLNYFGDLILSGLSKELRQELFKLALLEDIPLQLAELLSPNISIASVLDSMARRNLFLHRRDHGGPTFMFHHLFHAYMRRLAEQRMPWHMQRRVLILAGEWFLDQGRPEESLWYYLRTQDFARAEKVMRQVGPQLLAANRTVTLQSALERIPEKVIGSFGWLAYFKGAVLLSLAPPRARDYLDVALHAFIDKKDAPGELLASTHLITYYAAVAGLFKQGEAYLPRSIAIYQTLAHQLAPSARVQAATAIAIGLCFFQSNSESAEEYIDEIHSLANEKGLNDALAGAAMIAGNKCGLQGDWPGGIREIENSLQFLQDPQVSGFNRMCLVLLQANLAAIRGDFDIYRYHKRYLHPKTGRDLAKETIVGPFLYILDAIVAVAEGDEQAAVESAQKGLSAAGAAATPHLRSQYYIYLAYAKALQGDVDEAVQAAVVAEKLRDEAGGRFFEVLNQLLLGCVYTHTGNNSEAVRWFDAALEGSRALGETVSRAGVYACRSYLHLQTGREKAALEDLRHALHHLKAKGYVYCYGWHPRVMAKVLSTAVKHGIDSDYARFLARERLGLAFTVDGEPVPLLDLMTLGPAAFVTGRHKRVDFTEITPTQRELLALLVAAPHHQLSQEYIQAVFWPESPPKKARSTFDSLLSRLRKVLDEHLGISSARHYLVLEKGLLRLHNCRIDAHRFVEFVKRGMAHLRRKENWQAANAFYSAHRLYHGEYMSGVSLRDAAGPFRDQLMLQYLKSTLNRIGILGDLDRTAEAVQVAEEALRCDPTHEPLVKALYRLCIKSSQPVKAHKVIKTFQEALRRDGYSDQELEAVMEAFWNSVPSN